MIIEKNIHFEGARGEKKATALFDSGSTYSCIHPELTGQLGNIEPIRRPFQVETAEKGRKIEITQAVRLDFYIDGYHFSDEFVLVPNLAEEIIIGTYTMQKWRLKLDFEHDQIIIDPRATRLRI